MPWTPESTKVLIELYNLDYSYLEIAKIINKKYNLSLSRQAIDKKVWRLINDEKILKKRSQRKSIITPKDLTDEEILTIDWLKNNPLSIGELSRRLDRSKETIIRLLDNLKNKGYDINLDKAEKRAILEREYKKKFLPLKLKLVRNYLKIGAVSDPHLGSKFQQMTLLHTVYKEFDREKVDFIVHAGDLTEGIDMYSGQEQECFLHGADDMRDYTIEHYPKSERGMKTYVIGGSHDMSFKKKAGFNIVRAICEKRNDLVYRGEEGASFKIKGLNIEILHPSGGVAYAQSYRPQKIIEGIVGEMINIIRQKRDTSILPNILFFGHYHIATHLPSYFGIEGYGLPCLQAQTPYLKRKGLMPKLGYMIVEVWFNEMGNIVKVRPDFRYLGDLVKENDY